MASLGERRALITGASGFTGQHLAQTLSRDGWSVFGIGEKKHPALSDFINADLAETDRLTEWIADVRPTHIIHLAALSNVVGDPLSFYRVNVLGTESLLDAISRSSVLPSKILIASSANIYGNAMRSPITEQSPLSPMNHYAFSKVAMELLVQKWFDRFPIVLTRPFNYTGPGQSDSFVFPKIVAAFRKRELVLRLGNLEVARDLSDVSFVCEAYRRILLSGISSERLNVCSGRSVSLLSALDLMEQIAGYRPTVVIDPAFVRKDEIQDLCGDGSKLAAEIGYIEPMSLRDILERLFAEQALAHQT